MKDIEIMQRFLQAGAAALEAGLKHARQEDPHVYKELVDLVRRGLCVPEIVLRLKPYPTVSFRLVGEVMEEGVHEPMVIEVFTYGGSPDAPELNSLH